MATLTQATNAATAIRWGRDVLAPASVWAGGGVLGAATGVNPATEATSLALGHPLISAQALFLTNPFQRTGATGRYNLSRFGLFGYKTLISGVGPGGLKRNLTAGNLILSTIQGAARGLHAFGLWGEGNLATAVRYARTVGAAGILNPSAAVHTVSGGATGLRGMLPNLGSVRMAKVAAESVDELKASMGSGRRRAHSILRQLAGAGPVTSIYISDVPSTPKHVYMAKPELRAQSRRIASTFQVEGIGPGKSRIITPVLSEEVTPQGLYVGKVKAGKGWHNFRVRTTRFAMGATSIAVWASIVASLTKSVAGAALKGTSNLAITAIELLRSVSSRDLTPAQIPSIFMTAESATERQRAVQAIYGAKINPANRFMGNEAQMYHA